MDKKDLTYEAAMQRLDELARQMEAGDIPIDELALKLKEAQQLISFCRDKLTKANDEISNLLKQE